MTLTTLPLTVVTETAASLFPNPILSEAGPAGNRLALVQKWRGSGMVLQKNLFGNSPDIKAVHYLSGCGHQCAFCPTRTPRDDVGRPVVRLLNNAAELLHVELTQTFQPPQAVYLAPDSDPFLPSLDVQCETARVVETLARHSVQSWLMTRGFIRPLALEVLVRYKDRVKVMMGLTTLDRGLQRLLEPLSAPPALRLKQIRQLRTLGVPVQAALEPLIPGLTDTRDNLLNVLENLAELGVKRVTAGYLFLPPGAQAKLQEHLRPHRLEALVLDSYADGFERRLGDGSKARFLSRSRRQQGYALLMALAARFGITVSISSMSNPDFARPEPQKVFAQGYLPGLWQQEKVTVG